MLMRFRVLKIMVLAVAGISALSWVVMLLWNWLMPALFVGARSIDFLQSLGLLVLSKILFGGMRGHGGWHKHHDHHCHHRRWEKLTPEEREKFKHGMFGRRRHRDEKHGHHHSGHDNHQNNHQSNHQSNEQERA